MISQPQLLTGDQEFMFELFAAASRRFREGKPERVGVVFHFIRTFYHWEEDRISATYKGLIDEGAIVLNSRCEIRPQVKLSPDSSKPRKDAVGNRCAYCRCRLTKKNASKDHVVPKCRIQGELNRNIVWACKTCNQLKGNRTPHEWARDILRYNCKVSNPGPSRLQRWLIQARVAIGSWLAWIAS